MVGREDEEIQTKLSANKRTLKGYIKNLSVIQKDLYKISQTNIKVKEILYDSDDSSTSAEENNQPSSDPMWKQLNNNFKLSMPFMEETVNRWNARN